MKYGDVVIVSGGEGEKKALRVFVKMKGSVHVCVRGRRRI